MNASNRTNGLERKLWSSAEIDWVIFGMKALGESKYGHGRDFFSAWANYYFELL